jgi:copper transport protein
VNHTIRLNAGIRILAAGLIILLLALGLARRAQAHAELVRSEPADNSVLTEAPQSVSLWFSEKVDSRFSSVQLLDVNGVEIANTSSQVDSSDPTLLRMTLPALGQGIYSANWKVISATDGHLSRGYIVFRIGENPTGEPAPQAGLGTRLIIQAIPDIALRWLNYLALMLLVGMLGVLFFVIRAPIKAGEPASEAQVTGKQVQSRIFRFGKASIGFAALIGLAQLVWQASSLGSTIPAGANYFLIVSQILTSSRWGYAWLAREILLVILFFLVDYYQKNENPGRLAWILGGAAAFALLIAQSLASHAATEQNPIVPTAVNSVHMLFASLWIGGLIALAYGYFPAWRHSKNEFVGTARAAWGKFSWLAALSVGLVIATGIYSTGQQVVSADALVLSPYGRTLSAKVVLVLLAGMIGLSNSVLLHPRLAAPLAHLLKKPAGWTPLRPAQLPRLIMMECITGVLVVFTVGVLTTFPPAKNPLYTIAPGQLPDSAIRSVHDIFVAFSIKPNRPGQNVFDVRVSNTRRPPPAEILRVIVKMTYLDQDIGTTSQDAELVEDNSGQVAYRMINNYLAQPGHWSINVVVRRKGLPDSSIVVPWIVVPNHSLGPTLISRTPWQAALTILAGAFALLVLIAAGLVWHSLRNSPHG